MNVSAKTREWLEWVLVTSVPLRRLDSAVNPVGFASACLIHYRDKRFLLSVQHAVKLGSKDWIVDLGYVPGKGTEFFRPHGFNYVAEMKKGEGSIRSIDLCFAEVPNDLVSMYQYMTPRGISDERPRHVFHTDLTPAPDPAQVFAFAGQANPEQHAPQSFALEMSVYPGLRYLRSENEFHVFQLPVEHPGHVTFHGCSGAPIVDFNKNVVALVCQGDTTANTVHGVSLARYKFALDFVFTGSYRA